MTSASTNLGASLLSASPPPAPSSPAPAPTGLLETFAAAMECASDESFVREPADETGDEPADQRPGADESSPDALVAAAAQLAFIPPPSQPIGAGPVAAETVVPAVSSGSSSDIGPVSASGGESNASPHPEGASRLDAIGAQSATAFGKADAGSNLLTAASTGADSGVLRGPKQVVQTPNASPAPLPSSTSEPATAPETGQTGLAPASKEEDGMTQSPDSQVSPEKSSPRGGIGAAQVGIGMDGTVKMEIFADQSAVSALATSIAAADEAKCGTGPARRPNPAEIIAPGGSAADPGKFMTDIGLSVGPSYSTDPTGALPPAAGSLVVERIASAITEQAVQIRRQDRESLSLVVRPDAQTELRVDLRWIDGQIEARAFLHHGDRSAVESQWSDLQERLHRHGVRLTSLEQDGGGAASGQPDHFSPRREPVPVPEAEAPRTHRPLQPPPTQTTPPVRHLLRGILECYA